MGAKKESREWNQGVDTYTELPDVSNVEVIFPAILDALGNLKHKRVLDYGCGDGRLARRIHERGASVVGVDTSPSMIKIARSKTPNNEVTYIHMTGNNLRFLPKDSFDWVVANLVFMMLQRQKNIEQSMKNIHHVLRKGGTMIYSLTHPCFVDRGAHDYRNVFARGRFNYMKEEYPYRFILQDADGSEIDEKFYDFHHHLSTYLNTTIESGFSIRHMRELSYSPTTARRHRVPSVYTTFPQSMIVVAKKE